MTIYQSNLAHADGDLLRVHHAAAVDWSVIVWTPATAGTASWSSCTTRFHPPRQYLPWQHL